MQISTADETHYPNLGLRMWRLCEPNLKLVMRVCSLFIALTLITTQMLMATTTRNGQDAKVTLELKGESLESALRKIEKLSPYRFVYRSEEINSINNIHLERGERTVDETLALILKDTPMTFKLMNKNILIVKKLHTTSLIENESMEHKITGKISDETGEPLAGVSIVLKGTSVGTTSDGNGEYSLWLLI